jgi:hypothetical protein
MAVNVWIKTCVAGTTRTGEGARPHTIKTMNAKRTVRSPRDCPPNPPG